MSREFLLRTQSGASYSFYERSGRLFFSSKFSGKDKTISMNDSSEILELKMVSEDPKRKSPTLYIKNVAELNIPQRNYTLGKKVSIRYILPNGLKENVLTSQIVKFEVTST